MKEDKRIKKSRNALKSALFEEIITKNFNQITVTQLCKSANVNRSTFYSNYVDLQALLSDIHNDFFEEMMKHALKESKDIPTNYELTQTTLIGMTEYIENNKKIVQILFRHGNQQLLEKDMIYYFLDRHCTKCSDKVEAYPFLYHTLAFFALLNTWIKDDFPCSADQLAQIIIEEAKTFHKNISREKNKV